jgi:uncharacterized protein (DUF433 family)
MTTKTKAKSRVGKRSGATRRKKSRVGADHLSRREAALLAEVSLRSVDKAIEEKVVKPRRRRAGGVVLDRDDVLALALIARAGLPLQPRTKKQIRSWVPRLHRRTSPRTQELPLSDVLWIRLDESYRALAQQMDRYLEGRDRYVESDSEIQGGEPIIKGTRLPVRAVAERLNRGDSVDDLAEDYPGIPKTAFEAARIYAQSHPRRGRPARPWRDA